MRETGECVGEALSFASTRYQRARLDALIDAVPPHWKGAPLGDACSLRRFAASGIDALGGALPLPLLLLRESSLVHNVGRMARFTSDQDVLFAPHSKTTMSPELIARQIEAGCWAITSATPSQAQTLRLMGVQRILIANEIAEPAQVDWLADEMKRDPELEIFCLIDSTAGVALLHGALQAAGAPRPVCALLEVGPRDGRAGVRELAQAREVAQAAGEAASIELVGIECFEGLAMDPTRVPEIVAEVDVQLDAVHAIAEELRGEGLIGQGLISAGGSAFFDRVLARFPRPGWRVVLRSGCYISQDGGFYAQASPLAGRGMDASPLQDALELWAVVLSCPEAGVVVVGAGKRDAPFDITLPKPVAWRSVGGGQGGELRDASVLRLNDQHMTIALTDCDRDAGHRAKAGNRDVALADGPRIGDLVRFTISHPCGAFDRWRVIPIVDDEHRMVDAVHTLF
jgi:D-serine dehydratase